MTPARAPADGGRREAGGVPGQFGDAGAPGRGAGGVPDQAGGGVPRQAAGASGQAGGLPPEAAGIPPRTARVHREAGAVPVEFALGVGVLVLPIALLVLLLPTWVERQSAARLAAREAARAVVLADSLPAGVAAGEHAAARVAANHDIDPEDFAVTFAGELMRGGQITATLDARFPATVFPGFGEVAGFTWTVTHTEHVDHYRSLP